ncbi:MAG: pYEATS domain-containing protein [candidate division Zixibacteria bacterium]
MYSDFDIKIIDSAFDPDLESKKPKKIYYNNVGEKTVYKVWIFLEGKSLPYIKDVTYILHPTFADPIKTISRSSKNPRCKLEIWTWGLFQLRVKIRNKKGEVFEKTHNLTYNRDFPISKDDFEPFRS